MERIAVQRSVAQVWSAAGSGEFAFTLHDTFGFPVDLNKKPDVFLRVPPGTKSRRGSASTAATHRARNVLAKLGL